MQAPFDYDHAYDPDVNHARALYAVASALAAHAEKCGESDKDKWRWRRAQLASQAFQSLMYRFSVSSPLDVTEAAEAAFSCAQIWLASPSVPFSSEVREALEALKVLVPIKDPHPDGVL